VLLILVLLFYFLVLVLLAACMYIDENGSVNEKLDSDRGRNVVSVAVCALYIRGPMSWIFLLVNYLTYSSVF